MYEDIGTILGAVCILMGTIMALFPRMATRKDKRNTDSLVRRTRMNGIGLVILGIIIFVGIYLILGENPFRNPFHNIMFGHDGVVQRF